MNPETLEKYKSLYVCNKFLLAQFKAKVMSQGVTDHDLDWLQSCEHEIDGLLATILYLCPEFEHESQGLCRLDTYQVNNVCNG